MAIVVFHRCLRGAGTDNATAAIKTLYFAKGRYGRPLRLADVRRSWYQSAGVTTARSQNGGAFDPQWETKASWS